MDHVATERQLNRTSKRQSPNHAVLHVLHSPAPKMAVELRGFPTNSLRTTDHTGREAGIDAMKKLRIPLADIGRLDGARGSLPVEVELTITGIDQNNQQPLAAVNLLPDHVRSKISALDLSGSTITDAGVACSTDLSQLQSLNLSECRDFSTDVLAYLQGMTTLQSLDLSLRLHLTQRVKVHSDFQEIYVR